MIADIVAPNPLSMFTTVTPVAHELSVAMADLNLPSRRRSDAGGHRDDVSVHQLKHASQSTSIPATTITTSAPTPRPAATAAVAPHADVGDEPDVLDAHEPSDRRFLGTARSQVPAVSTARMPRTTGGGASGAPASVHTRAKASYSIEGSIARILSYTSGSTRVAMTADWRSRSASMIFAICSGVFPGPHTTSGRPVRAVRPRSSLAKSPTSSVVYRASPERDSGPSRLRAAGVVVRAGRPKIRVTTRTERVAALALLAAPGLDGTFGRAIHDVFNIAARMCVSHFA